MRHTGIAILTLFAALLLMFDTALAQGPAKSDSADEAAIRQADADWIAAINAKSIERTLAMYDADAVTAGAVMSPRRGLDEIKAMWMKVFSEPGMSVTWKYDHIVVMESGTMAAGAATWRREDLNVGGPGLVVWRKQPDGRWKVLVDAAWASQ